MKKADARFNFAIGFTLLCIKVVIHASSWRRLTLVYNKIERKVFFCQKRDCEKARGYECVGATLLGGLTLPYLPHPTENSHS